MNVRIVLTGVALGASLISNAWPVAAAATPGVDLAQARHRLAALSVPFVANAGQWDSRAAFAAQTFAGTLFVTADGQLVYSLPGKTLEPRTGDAHAAHRRDPSEAAVRGPGTVLTETLVDDRGRPVALAPSGDRALPTQVSFFVGDDPSRHRSALGSFERIALGAPYPGIDVQLRAAGNNVEKIFTIAPAHDPRAIRVRLSGAERLELAPDGSLIAHTNNGAVTYTAPIAFQEDAAGKRNDVPVRYALLRDSRTYGFAVGDYDAARPLVIDPLLQATYLHGSFGAIVYALMVLPGGDVVVAGSTISNDFPCTTNVTAGCANGAQPAHNATFGNDVFIARLSANLQTIVQATYFGGSGEDVPSSIVYQPAGDEIVVAGYTQSTNLACTNGGGSCGVGGQATHGGGSFDGFIARFSASLTSLLQATYFGGTGNDIIRTLGIGTGNTLIVGGSTTSADLPCTNAGGICADGAQKTLLGSTDGFVARFSASLTSLQQATYFGGTNNDQIQALAIDPANGDVVAAGYAFATDLPCTKPPGCGNGAQTAKAAGLDGFVVRMPASLTSFRQATYLGGNGNDEVTAIAIHPVSGEVIVAGETSSSDFPCVSFTYGQGCTNGGQMLYGSGTDGFVARLSGNLTNLLQATYVGGSLGDILTSIAVHPVSGEIFVGGYTASIDLPCTTSVTAGCANGAQQTAGGGDEDAFVARLSADLTFLLQATYLGGSGNDYVFALAIHPASGEILVAGDTQSADLPCTTIATPGCGNGAQQSSSGGEDGYVARFSPDLTLADNMPGPLAFVPATNVAPGSQQTSNAVQITGITGSADLYVDGDRTSSYCVAATSACACASYSALKSTVAAGQFVCVRHIASSVVDQVTRTNLHVGGARATYFVTTGALLGSTCSLDVDGNGTIDPLTDGLMLMRAMFGMTGTAVTAGALGSSPSRPDWTAIRGYLNGNCGTNFAQ